MHYFSATVAAALLAVVAAAPTELGELDERAAAPCTTKYTGTGDPQCGAVGFSSVYSKYIIEIDTSNAQNADYACHVQCNRNPDCLMIYLSPEKKCRLYNADFDHYFTPNSTATGHYSKYSCGTFAGNCLLANGGFENGFEANGYPGVHPWSVYGSTGAATTKLLQASQDTFYSDSPNGSQFFDYSITDQDIASQSQYIKIKLGVPQKVTYLYNFRQVTTPAGSVPSFYNIQVIWCGAVVHTQAVSTTKNINVWRTTSFQFTPTKACDDPLQLFKVSVSAKNGPANPNGYTARVGIDGITLAAA